MSAITGMYYRDGCPISDRILKQMVKLLAHRGSDDCGIWCDHAVGFGHRMLWTTPESLLEKLPCVGRVSRCVITADAILDNREALYEQLDLHDRAINNIPDSEFILAAYEKWGEDCPDYLLGDFAFVIWDPHQQRLFCARDHFGVKPFYYYLCDRAFVFATEIKALFAVPEVPQQINDVHIGDYLSSLCWDLAGTSYDQIFRLPPAHRMTISATEVHIDRYWSLDRTREIRLESNEAYAAEFRRILTEAVRCRLRSAFPIGSMLSGGIDSSSVTAIARDLLSEQQQLPLPTFSIVFDRLPDCNERPYIQPIVDQGGLQPHWVTLDDVNMFEDLPSMFWHQDEVVYAPAAFMTWNLYRSAQKQGIRILLSGFDGDTTVSDGYGYPSELARAGRWWELTREVWAMADHLQGPFWSWWWAYIKRYAVQPTIDRMPSLVKRVWWKLTGQLTRPQSAAESQNELLNPAFADRIQLAQRREYDRTVQAHLGLDEREYHYRNIATQGMPILALETFDRDTAAFNLEVRYPFWDKRLVEFCLALPPDQKRFHGWNRVVMRRAMEGMLPKSVQWRKAKADFTPTVNQNFLRQRSQIAAWLDEDAELLAPYLDLDQLKQLYQRFVSTSEIDSLETFKLWRVLSLSRWLRYRSEQSQPECISVLPTQ